MMLTSPDIREGELIHHKFTCQGINISPALEYVNVPDAAKSLALIVHDPDALPGDWVHWVVFNIPPDKVEFSQGWAYGLEGKNSSGKEAWEGPCPPTGKHRYIFEAYALDAMVNLKKGATRQELEAAMQGHILDKAELMGLYEKF
ncbi:MAG: YbhB/YbcL family Raf kinase inhibitor-like protein [Candidatus Omnitrophica bacterium]|nr:YbhB/YbcL family Raf kinase inhibitor-like protein [Candidatus Omnitrophota bacterium]